MTWSNVHTEHSGWTSGDQVLPLASAVRRGLQGPSQGSQGRRAAGGGQ